MKWHKIIVSVLFLAVAFLTACSDDDVFTTSSSYKLAFSESVVNLDTIFSKTPSSTHAFWVYNTSGKSLRCTNVRLENGNQTGFRVNVDGTYLGQEMGYQVQDVEIHAGDSIRVFVELTSPENGAAGPQKVTDNLVFKLESGVEQKVELSAWSWDAVCVRGLVIDKDSVISTKKPLVVYDGITVAEDACLTLSAGTNIYFHENAGIVVKGSLKALGEAGKEVVLRGDRLDKMFDYLPYDLVSGQWQGLHFGTTSYDNVLQFTDIHSTYDGIVCDSSDVEKEKISIEQSTIHNCQGYGLLLNNVKGHIYNSQITNVLNDCVCVNGGDVKINGCTLAQFYPFDSARGAALRFSSVYALLGLKVMNSIITGYADDVLMGVKTDTEKVFNYAFSDCIIRTPKIETEDSVYFTNVVYENVNNTSSNGEKHFNLISADTQHYDFHLAKESEAIAKGNAETIPTVDREGRKRGVKPCIGAFEYVE
ncbi:MAG: right-handed parallel beta-helix repeat-containing protein [Prevotella sp.]|nr:right-handed parallel beta-helix repeat-containing protein [Prevotella sp.]